MKLSSFMEKTWITSHFRHLYLSKPSQSIEECELYQHLLLNSLIHTHIKTKTEGWALYIWEGDFSHNLTSKPFAFFFQDNAKLLDNKVSVIYISSKKWKLESYRQHSLISPEKKVQREISEIGLTATTGRKDLEPQEFLLC